VTPHDSAVFQDSMIVIFLDRSCAISCANDLHNKWLNERQLKVLLFLPTTAAVSVSNNFEDEGTTSDTTKSGQDFDLDNFFNNLL
jgi:hypothetical protein